MTVYKVVFEKECSLRRVGSYYRAVMRAHKESHLLICVGLFLFSFSSYLSSAGPLYCKSQRQFNLNGLHKFGDVILGGIFKMNLYTASSELFFTSGPQHPMCFG